jgi:glycosylphosphatidylinositol transamidase (GPIT) subunit GPI8
MGDLFDSYDEEKIHSHPGVRYDLFSGGESEARSRLVMDFFGNVQNVEVEGGQGRNESEWRRELEAIEMMIEEAKRRHNESLATAPHPVQVIEEAKAVETMQALRREGAMRVDEESGWKKQAVGAAALLGCVGMWVAGSWFEKKNIMMGCK